MLRMEVLRVVFVSSLRRYLLRFLEYNPSHPFQLLFLVFTAKERNSISTWGGRLLCYSHSLAIVRVLCSWKLAYLTLFEHETGKGTTLVWRSHFPRKLRHIEMKTRSCAVNDACIFQCLLLPWITRRVVTPSRFDKVRWFGGIYSIHLQGQNVSAKQETSRWRR
jgi:hypothetical protein